MNVFIYPNFQKKNAHKCTISIINMLKSINCNIYMDIKYKQNLDDINEINKYIIYEKFDLLTNIIEYAIAIGGDGTILQCAKMVLKTNIKLVGVNTGRLGFMSSIECNELSNIKKIETNEFKISRRMMIKGILNGKEVFNALNDIVVYESKSKMSEFTVKADGILVGNYRSNGIILSTPTGSTAYALSAGGPVIHPELKCMELSLICPHSLFARPLIFSDNCMLEITANIRDNQKIFINADGENEIEFDNNSKLYITKSDYFIDIVDFKGSTFFNTLNEKLMHPIK